MKRRTFLTAGAGATAAALATPAIAQGKIEWNLPTSFPKNAPGVGTNVTNFAEKVAAMSDGRLSFKVFGGGELVPPFGVEDAVQQGKAPVGHNPPYYAAGKNPALHWFTAVPFGMTAAEHYAWLRYGGGQEIWDDIYAQRNLKPLYSGNSNTQSAGWFKSEINSLDDLKGLNMRIAGLGGEMYRKLGVNAVLMPPPEIFQALQSGALDAAEWVGPFLDQAFGLQKITKNCYLPAYNEPSAALAIVFNKDAWAELSPDLQAICEAAALAASQEALAQFDYHNARAMASLEADGVIFRDVPDDVAEGLKGAWEEVREELTAQSEDVARVRESYDGFLAESVKYANAMNMPLLQRR
ncbi:TRAP transporter substrate-binding protein [Nitratireductor aquimarinus]|uniref:TRAP transporter substrate-binding protein n=1 Tax=Nitratireductor aquimarinus TaxID=889300 RepID=A0ABU4AMU4_9HYPH|nr:MULTISPECIES: TRAP transporter substrate-binding protein [Alphaproteobacteria]MBY6023074.1 TRAP transporter substrate-binding protein [Nitratireductor sp. DP7N14-4]MBN7758281.1 TRAP transporter substrate-binding protein [Nitratireductor aquimarinus]MBN7776121.1 TRAP transporter substrate-binding protein [Nitratireductor pacificus]MBN7778988.1 TRAP transporter substrate-binding protein [Nitratireductor pacificus]MBN7787795.1 TRAP transporter substrate-binding protein [Nitratireductor aquimar